MGLMVFSMWRGKLSMSSRVQDHIYIIMEYGTPYAFVHTYKPTYMYIKRLDEGADVNRHVSQPSPCPSVK